MYLSSSKPRSDRRGVVDYQSFAISVGRIAGGDELII